MFNRTNTKHAFFLGLMLVVGLGFGTLLVDSFESEPPVDEQVESDVVDTAQGDVAVVDLEPTEQFASFYATVERLPAPMTNMDGALQGYAFIDVTLVMASEADQAYVDEHMPRVQDAFIRALAKNGVGRSDNPAVFDYDRVAAYLLEAANEALGGSRVQEILFVRDERSQ